MIFWQDKPLVKIFISLAIGILIAENFATPALASFYQVGIISGLICFNLSINSLPKLKTFHRLTQFFPHLIFLTLGFFLHQNHLDLSHPNHFSNLPEQERWYAGTISKKTIRSKYHSFELNISDLRSQKDWIPVSGNLSITCESTPEIVALSLGDKIVFKAKARVITPSKNPSNFNFVAFSHYKNIHYQAFVQSQTVNCLEKNKKKGLIFQAIQAKNQLLEILKTQLPTTNEYAVGAAMILGDRSFLNKELKQTYSETGAMHVLAVSGLHVGILVMVLEFFLGLFLPKSENWQKIQTLFLLIALWSYVLLTGCSPSVIRAGTMFSFMVMGRFFPTRISNAYNNLAASALFLLVYDPFLLFHVGFQLSHLAVLGILYFHPKIYDLFYFKNVIVDYFWQLICVSLSATLMTAPISIFVFQQFPTYFLLTGTISVIMAFAIMALAVPVLVLGLCFEPLTFLFGIALYYTIWAMNAFLLFLNQLPHNILLISWLSSFACMLLYLLIAQIAMIWYSGQKKLLFALATTLFLLVFNFHFHHWRQYQQHSFQVYYDKEDLVACYRNRFQTYLIYDEEAKDKLDKYIPPSQRIATVVHVESKDKFEDEYFFQDSNNWLVGKQAIGFFLSEKDMKKKGQFANIFLVRNEDMPQLEQLINLPKKEFILHPSLRYKTRKAWIKACEKSHHSYYDMKEMGAYFLDLREKDKVFF